MGELIRRTASADDIIADVRGTLTSAGAKGGTWKELAEQRLSGVVALIDNVETQLEKAEAKRLPLLAAVDAKNDEADALLGHVSDEICRQKLGFAAVQRCRCYRASKALHAGCGHWTKQ